MLEVPLLSRTRTAQGLFGRSSFIAAPQHNSRLVEPEVLVIFHVIVPLLSVVYSVDCSKATVMICQCEARLYAAGVGSLLFEVCGAEFAPGALAAGRERRINRDMGGTGLVSKQSGCVYVYTGKWLLNSRNSSSLHSVRYPNLDTTQDDSSDDSLLRVKGGI